MSNPIKIEPAKNWFKLDFNEIWEYRELAVFLAWRDIMVQYKQTFFGVVWAIVQPLISILVFTVVFGKIAKLSSSGIPYPVFTLSGLIAWIFFASSLGQSTVSLLDNSQLVTKIYFPRIIIPIASLGRGAVNFLVSFIVLIFLMLIYKFTPSQNIIFLPLFLAMGLAITLGMGCILSAISARYHDLKYAITFFIQIWFWITPVAYGIENIPQKLQIYFYLNPMTWIIQGFRWSLLGVGSINWLIVAFTGLFSIIILLSGLLYFRRMENFIADII